MSERLQSFQEKGYTIIRGLLSEPELCRLRDALEKDKRMQENTNRRSDGKGMRTRACLWNTLPNNIAGAIARSEKVVNLVEELLEGEVYHYHSKVIMKDASEGGAFLWHQDYGYWYNYKCLYPTMGTMWIAVDQADRTNGCLQILEGSHHMGRVDHVKEADQVAAVIEKVDAAKKRLPLRYVELNPGDAVFFHCNLLHTSDQNVSGRRRWSFLVAYNRSSNIPYGEQHHAAYEPLQKLADSAIMTSPLDITDEKMTFLTNKKNIDLLADLPQQTIG